MNRYSAGRCNEDVLNAGVDPWAGDDVTPTSALKRTRTLDARRHTKSWSRRRTELSSGRRRRPPDAAINYSDHRPLFAVEVRMR
jgi:hypothetical protein